MTDNQRAAAALDRLAALVDPAVRSTAMAVQIWLEFVLALSRGQALSVWTAEPGGAVRHVAHAGMLEPTEPRVAHVARALLAGQPATGAVGVEIPCLSYQSAVLVAHDPAEPAHDMTLLAAAASGLAAVLDRDQQRPATRPAEDVMTAVERRLARLRFDLHDGPQQDVHLLAIDLNLFREQLLPSIAKDPNADRILGRLEDLSAQLVALDGDLRRLSSAVQSPFLHPGSLPDALGVIIEPFAARTGIVPRTELSGDFSRLTDSQQITLLALIREALSNVREHSRARNVTITIRSRADGLDAQIVDDGRGFDPETTLVRAARDGHLGLVGMHERVRMLGGNTSIDSRAGGPTVISVSLPPWPAGG